MRAVRITRFGGPEVMEIVDLADPVPGDGEQTQPFDVGVRRRPMAHPGGARAP
jgi:hypothetical protein